MNKNTPLNTPYPIVDNPPKVVEINKEFLNPKEFNILDAKIFEKNLTNLLIDKINPIQNTGSIFRNLLNTNISKETNKACDKLIKLHKSYFNNLWIPKRNRNRYKNSPKNSPNNDKLPSYKPQRKSRKISI